MGKEKVHDVFQSVAKQYDVANDRISFGAHRLWKRALISEALCNYSAYKSETDVFKLLDVCCGTGDIVYKVATNFPDILVIGLDFSSEMLKVAKERCKNLDNVMLVEGNACNLPFKDNTFDAATISFGLRNTPDYKKVISEMTRSVKDSGIVACLDASVPENKIVFPFYNFYYKNIMPVLGGGIKKREEYDWLYQSTADFLSKKELRELFESCGLKQNTMCSFMMGAAALHVGIV